MTTQTEQTNDTELATGNDSVDGKDVFVPTYDGVTAYPVTIDFRKRKPVLDGDGKVITTFTDKDDTLEILLDGKKVKVKAERIPSFTANLPVINGQYILDSISSLYGDATNEDLPEQARKEASSQLNKLLEYFAEYHNYAIKDIANKQLNEKLKVNVYHKFTQSDIILNELYFWELVNKEPVDRRQFSDDLIAEAKADFITVIPQFASNSKGQLVSMEGATNVAAIIFSKKDLEKFKTNKDGLATFQAYAGVWLANTSQESQEKFVEYYTWLNTRIDTWLNIDTSSVLATFE